MLVTTNVACVAGGIRDRVHVLCLGRMAERGNRGAARELEQAGLARGEKKQRAKPACVSNSTPPVVVQFIFGSISSFSFVLSSLSHITIHKIKGK